MRNLTNTSSGSVIINTLSGGTAVSVLNNDINLDINKLDIVSTTSANDQYVFENSSGVTKKIFYSDLISSSGSGLTAGEALSITGSTIDLSISKQNAITTSVDTDLYVLEDSAGNIKKITRANLLAGTISAEWSLSNTTLSTLSNTTNVVMGATAMNGSEKLRVNGDTQMDGKLTINGSNVLEATALSGSYNFNIQNTNVTNNGTLNLMGVNSGGASNLLTIRNDSVLPKLTFPFGIWTNNYATNISDTELSYLDGASSNIQNQLNILTSGVSTNATNIGTNASNITALQTQQSTNTSNITSLQSQQSQNTSAISTNAANISSNSGSISSLQSQQNTNTSNISSLQSQQSTNTGNITTNAGDITNIKNKYDFTGSVSNGKLLIGSAQDYVVGELLSSDNTVTITKSAGSIDLVVPSSTSLGAGTGINITANNINYDIQKETAYTTPASADTMLMYDSTNTAIKKITFSDFNAGLQTQITSNDTDITNLKNKYDFASTVSDGELLIGSTANNNYSSGVLTSTGGTMTITNSSHGINLESNHTTLTGGVAVDVNSSDEIDVDITKPSAFTSPVNADLLLMYDSTNSLTKKITYQNFNASLQNQITANDTDITNIKGKYDFSTTILDGYLLMGSTANNEYQGGVLSSSDNSITITNSSGGINLQASAAALTGGVAVDVNSSDEIDVDITKPSVFTSPVSGDLLLMYDTTNSATKKITFANFNSGLQAQITSNDNDITSLTSSVNTNTTNIASLTTQQNTNTSDIATNSSNISTNSTEITNIKNKIAYSSTVTDGKLLIGNTSTGNYQVGNITSTGGGLTISNNAGNINIEAVGFDPTTNQNFGTNTSGALNIGTASQNINHYAVDNLSIVSGKNFFRSTATSGTTFQVQGYNQSGYSNAIEVINVSSPTQFPYLKFILSDGFNTSQYANKNLKIDANGKLQIDNLPAEDSNFGTASTSTVQVGVNTQSTFIHGDDIILKDKGEMNLRATANHNNTEYDLIKLNSTSNGDYPYTQLLDNNNLYGSSGQYLGLDSNNKLEWSNVSVSNPIQYVADTAAVIALTATSVDGTTAISASPRKLWLKSTVNNNAIWSSIDFIETATTLTSATGLINNTGSTFTFTSSGVGITLPNQNDYFNITVIVEDDYAPDITYPTDTTAFSTTNKAVSSSGTTHTFTAQINNLTSTSSNASYIITLNDKNTSTIITLQTISFTFNLSYTAPAFTSTSVSTSSCVSPYTSSDAGNATRYNSLGNIFTDRSYTFYNIDSNAFTNGSTMFNEGKTHYQSGSFFSGLTWNFILSSNVNYLYHFSTSSSTTPSNWTEANADGTNPVSKGWTNLGSVGNLQGWGNTAYAHRSTDAITAGKYITATRGSQAAFLVAIKDS